MAPTRRQFLAGASGLLGAGLLGTSGCGTQGSYLTPEGTLSLWYWNRSISDTLLAEAPEATGIPLEVTKVGGDFKSKLLTSLAGRAYVPDITGLNEDIATYFPDADQFVDLYELGAKDLQSEYLEWKWLRGVTPEGKLLGFPMDTGPSALYYRADIFEQAGLPTEPDEVAAQMQTWQDYFDAGEELVGKLPKVKMLPNINMVYDYSIGQQAERYLTPDNEFIGDGEQIRGAWNNAVEAFERKLDARAETYTPEWNGAMATGKVASFVGAVWMAQILSDAVGDSGAGNWRVCRCPGGAGNWGGSFLGITKYCRDPEAAWEIIKWVQSPESQVVGYTELALFPAALASLESQKLDVKNDFFGGQQVSDVFVESARDVKPSYLSPYDNVIAPSYTDEITSIWSAGKDPDAAWRDALHEANRQLSHLGLI